MSFSTPELKSPGQINIIESLKHFNDYLFKKKRETFFTQTLFSEWIIEMDHHECTTGGGVGCRSNKTFSLIHEKIIECEKEFFMIEHEVLFF
jgi:hypothetical protein